MPFTDDEYEALLPPKLRVKSGRFFTPVAVARRASELLREMGARWVLDVGSGAGKFCMTAAKASPEVDFVGVEQRRHLVELARTHAEQLEITNAHFICAEATQVELADYDALYFFNPFAENAFRREEQFDQTVELSARRYIRDILWFEDALAAAPIGTVVVTYHTFGGRIAGSYDLAHEEIAGTDRLRVWRKERAHAKPGRYYIEDDEVILTECAPPLGTSPAGSPDV